MAQRDLVKVAIGAAVGAFLATVVALVLTGRLGGGDRETQVTLSQELNGPCEMSKLKYVTVKQQKNLTWKIWNYCGSEAVVAVGNFRPQKDGGNSNCSAAGSASPFPGQQPASVTVPPVEDDGEPSKRQIKLKAKKLDNEERPETYYFDICLNGVSVDPTLMVER